MYFNVFYDQDFLLLFLSSIGFILILNVNLYKAAKIAKPITGVVKNHPETMFGDNTNSKNLQRTKEK